MKFQKRLEQNSGDFFLQTKSLRTNLGEKSFGKKIQKQKNWKQKIKIEFRRQLKSGTKIMEKKFGR